jgi:hypothetical protein
MSSAVEALAGKESLRFGVDGIDRGVFPLLAGLPGQSSLMRFDCQRNASLNTCFS